MKYNNIPIFIINLKTSKTRREYIEKQFHTLMTENEIALPYSFFEAINGKETPDFDLFKKYNKIKRLNIKGNELNLSQLGCLASHYLLWVKCIELNQPIIILEDDASLKPNFLTVYHFCHQPNNKFEFFWLCQNNSKNRKNKYIMTLSDGETQLSQYYGGWGNATGYFITPTAAQKLVDYNKEWIYEADISIDRYWENKISYLGIEPPCITPTNMESNIPINKGKAQRTLFIRIRREYYKLIDNIKKTIYDKFIN